MNTLLIDNYDSFTQNLVHLANRCDVSVSVCRNDELPFDKLASFTHLIIGPGPGLPAESGDLMKLLNVWPSDRPLLGVCLGMQAMLEKEGSTMRNLSPVVHGGQDQIQIHDWNGLFKGCGEPCMVGRYHSWGFSADDLPSSYRITASDIDGTVMAVKHVDYPWFGVQFHPESIMTSQGIQMMQAFFQLTSKPGLDLKRTDVQTQG